MNRLVTDNQFHHYRNVKLLRKRSCVFNTDTNIILVYDKKFVT